MDADFFLGSFSIIANDFYVVHSGVDGPSNEVRNTSNIFIIRGLAGAVWLFGAGYGNPGEEYLQWGGGARGGPSRDAASDAFDVGQVIEQCMGIAPGSAQLRFIVPHAHLDHVNSDLLNALAELGYDMTTVPMHVHTRDALQVTCNSPCCGSQPCEGEGDPNFANPHLPAWTSQQLANVVPLGANEDACDAEVFSFETASLGRFSVRAIPGHTAGAVNIDNPTLALRIAGSADRFCGEPFAVDLLSIHGAVAPLSR